jgi:retinol-binding protein 3
MKLAAAVVLGSSLLTLTAAAQPHMSPAAAKSPVDKKTRDFVLGRALELIEKNYVFPDVAAKIVADLGQKRQHGDYDALTTVAAFIERVTHDLRAHDRHLGLIFDERPVPPDHDWDERTPHDELERMRKMGELFNFGFIKVEVLDGNIGYLRLDGFMPAYVAGETAVAAMGFVANSDALIIDLRKNHGGDPTMAGLLGAYFFEGDPVHFNDFVMRDPQKTQQYWTPPWVPGKKYLDKPVFVLTSHETFSCGEEFTYDLQTQKRSVTVGETTGGGAHPVGARRIDDHYAVLVPFARALNPVTHRDWEMVGVQPDVKIDADHALAKAKVLAVQRIKARDPRHGEILKRVMKEFEAELAKPSTTTEPKP